MATHILGTYRITYPSYGNATQVKNLVSHREYEAITARQTELIDMIASLDGKKNQSTLEALQKELNTEFKRTKEAIATMFGDEWFTDKSPLWLSQENGGLMVMPPYQGGDIKVIIERV